MHQKIQVTSFMATRKISCVDPSAGFHGSPADGFFNRSVNIDSKLFITIASEAILGCEKTRVPGHEAAELFEELKSEMDDQTNGFIPDRLSKSGNFPS